MVMSADTSACSSSARLSAESWCDGASDNFDGEFTTQAMKEGKRRGGIVVALRNTSTAQILPLDVGPRRWLLGTDTSCDLHLVDPFVSKLHCVIERKSDGSLVVRDRDSRNGTFIDGNPVEGAELRVGSFLSVGRTTLVALANNINSERPRAIEMIRGHHPALRTAVEQGIRGAQTECSVLILGETGTGKDLMARLIHESSRRAAGPFVAVNCGAIPRELIASELFGHERGAFTGASDERDGYFVEANGGTLFLDEIGELPLELQPHLLRVLETRRVRRVGGQSDRPVDVRIVAATNQLDTLGAAGEGATSRLRLDLYHRIATMVLLLPPLRERMSDLVELVEAMLVDLAPEFGTKRVSADAWKALAGYAWPGNVRELRHAVARAVTLGGEELGPRDFFPEFHVVTSRLPSPSADTTAEQLVPYLAMLRGAMEQALQQYGSIRLAAASLGMPKSTFADRAKQWGLTTRVKPRIPRKK
jgi:transcriptional regulator with PAS, ATPase and Fis domain